MKLIHNQKNTWFSAQKQQLDVDEYNKNERM